MTLTKITISFKAIDISFLELCYLLIAKFVFYVFVHLFLSEKPWYPYYSLFEAMISTDKTNNIADKGYI